MGALYFIHIHGIHFLFNRLRTYEMIGKHMILIFNCLQLLLKANCHSIGINIQVDTSEMENQISSITEERSNKFDILTKDETLMKSLLQELEDNYNDLTKCGFST